MPNPPAARATLRFSFADRDRHERRVLSTLAPRYVVQHWHVRYNTCVLFFSLIFTVFYLYAAFSTPHKDQSSRTWKLLVGYTVLMALDLVHRSVLILRMKVFLNRYGEGEAEELPLERLRVLDILSHAASGYFVLACWITHAVFPLRPCEDIEYRLACSALHVISLSFMIWLGLTALVIVATTMYCFPPLVSLLRERSRWRATRDHQQATSAPTPERGSRNSISGPAEAGAYALSLTRGMLGSAQMARQRRMRVVHTLPTTAEPPPDGDVCGVCLEILANVEGVTGVTWRVLPCGHRFHAVCVDEWLARPTGACPTCRKDPTLDAQVEV